MNIPALHGNWVDLALLVISLFYLFGRSKRGFIEGVFDVTGFVFSLIFGLRFYQVASHILILNFSLSLGIANALGFLVMAFVGEFILYLVAMFILGFINKDVLTSKLNVETGFIPAIFSYLVLASLILTSALVFPIRPDVKSDIVHSRIGGFLTRQTLGLEQRLSEIFGGAVQDTLTFLTVKPQGKEQVDLHFETSEFSVDEASEKTMFQLVNQERQNNGLRSLVDNELLRSVARAHCEDMFKRGYFSHYTPDGLSPFDRMNNAGISYRAAGENLAYAPTVETAHTGLMNSPGHRANILSSDFGRVGIGVINGGIYGRMFCQEFTD